MIDYAPQAAAPTATASSTVTATPVMLPDDWHDLETIGYITHVDNIASILEHGILSYEAAGRYPHRSMADTDVQARRTHQIPGTGLTIHDHAIAYINPRNAMMYRLIRNSPLSEIAVLRLDARRVLGLPRALVTDQNAATDGVSFYPASTGMSQLDRNQVYAERWVIDGVRHEDTMRRMMAEVLVPGAISSSLITGIDAPTQASAAALTSRYPDHEVIVNEALFFQNEGYVF